MKVNATGSPQIPATPELDRKQKDKLLQACQDFESYLLEQVFRRMRATVPRSGLTETSFSREIFEGWQDEAFAREMARAGGVGLADQLYRQLRGEFGGGKQPDTRGQEVPSRETQSPRTSIQETEGEMT